MPVHHSLHLCVYPLFLQWLVGCLVVQPALLRLLLPCNSCSSITTQFTIVYRAQNTQGQLYTLSNAAHTKYLRVGRVARF